MANWLQYLLSEVPASAALVPVACGLILFLLKLHRARQFIYSLQRENASMPPFSVFTGHFDVLRDHMRTLPRDCTIHTVFAQIAQAFPNGMFYVDLWPFSRPLLIVTSAAGAVQMQDAELDKPHDIKKPLETLIGGKSLLTMYGASWKTWRGLLNPGFSSGYMLEMVPSIVREVAVFRDSLRAHARSADIFQMADTSLKLTIDVIGSAAMDTRLDHQRKENALATALRTQVLWTTYGTILNPFKRYLSIRPLVLWYNSRRMESYIKVLIDKRFSELKMEQQLDTGSKRSKSVLSLILQTYLKDNIDKTEVTLDSDFRDITAAQLRLFLFAGHDTTSSTLTYCYHRLATEPEILRRLRAEHDQVLGHGLANLEEKLSADPACLNRLPYTQAVIRETLRLHPPSSVMRIGREGLSLVDESGNRFPTEGCNVWVLAPSLHRNPQYWTDPESFLPDRWLVEPGHPLYPTDKAAWRPFSTGSRNCIGQTLAMMELRVALVMTVREFDILPAYHEWDKMGSNRGQIKTVNGIRAYEVEMGGGGAHPADGYPCRASFRAEQQL